MKINNSNIDKTYQYWRINLMLTMYVGYASFYLTRKSINFAIPNFIQDLNIDKHHIGLMATLFYITYGLSKFLFGIISDKINPRYFMAMGLLATGIINILFSFVHTTQAFTLLWILNACFQGWGWPACAKLLTSWYSRNERGRWWSIWNTAHNIGGAIVPLILNFFLLYYHWQYSFLLVGIITILMSIFLFIRLQNTPEKMGLPTIGIWRNDLLEQTQERTDENLSWRLILHTYVFSNKYIWLLAVSYILVYVVRTAISDWGNIYLTEKKHYNLITANEMLVLFEIGGIFGSLAAGWSTDKLFDSNRGPITLLFSIGIFISITALWLLNQPQPAFLSLLFFAIGFFIFGPQMLIGMAAAECSHKKSPGAATGFIGLFAYLGAALAGYPLALIIQHFGWTGFFTIIVSCAAGIALLFLPFLRVQK